MISERHVSLYIILCPLNCVIPLPTSLFCAAETLCAQRHFTISLRSPSILRKLECVSYNRTVSLHFPFLFLRMFFVAVDGMHVCNPLMYTLHSILRSVDPEDVDCLEGYCALMQRDHETLEEGRGGTAFKCPFASSVYIHAVEAKDAKGPTFARALLSDDIFEAYQDEKVSPQDHCLSIDSHMDFEQQFDESLVNMWDTAGNEYAMLSTYVADIEQLGVNLNGKHEVPHLCMVSFTSSVRTHATKCAQNLSKPKLTNAVYGAGLAFSKCHAELKVPVDSHTPYVFDGEEFNRGARLFTHGYDVYTPNRVFVLHNYHESQSNPKTSTWWKHTNREAIHESNKRLNNLLDILPLASGGQAMTEDEKTLLRQSKYGFGDRRSLDQLIDFTGIDLRHAKPSIDGNNRCGNLQWVPFVEHGNGVNYIPPYDADENPIDDYDEGSIWEQPLSHMRQVSESNQHQHHDSPIKTAAEEHHLRSDGVGGAGDGGGIAHVAVPNKNNHPIKSSAETTGETIAEKRKLRNTLLSEGKNLLDHSEKMLVARIPKNVADLPLPVRASVLFMMVGVILSLMIAVATKRKRQGGLLGKKQ
jgi:hypothetical protein